MKIRFLSRQQPRTGRPEGDPVYEEGQVYDLRQDQARKWLNRNVAELVNDERKAAPSSKREPDAAPEPDPRVARATDLDDPGTGASRPDAMTTADIKPDPTQPESSEPSEESSGEPDDDGLDSLTRRELLAIIEGKGIGLGPDYMKKDDLIGLLRASRG